MISRQRLLGIVSGLPAQRRRDDINRFSSIKDWSEVPRQLLTGRRLNLEFNPNVAPTELVPVIQAPTGRTALNGPGALWRWHDRKMPQAASAADQRPYGWHAARAVPITFEGTLLHHPLPWDGVAFDDKETNRKKWRCRVHSLVGHPVEPADPNARFPSFWAAAGSWVPREPTPHAL